MPLPTPLITGELFDSVSDGSRFHSTNLDILKAIYVEGVSRSDISAQFSLSYGAVVALERRFDKRLEMYLKNNDLSLVMAAMPLAR